MVFIWDSCVGLQVHQHARLLAAIPDLFKGLLQPDIVVHNSLRETIPSEKKKY
jgi:hypothetical protein